MPGFAPYSPLAHGVPDASVTVRSARTEDAEAVAPWNRPGAEPGPHVSALTVHPGHRRRGVGDRLLGALTCWTWDRAGVLWSIVNARNEASLALHARHGFATVRAIGSYAGTTFDGGRGVLLRARPADAGPQEEAL